MITLNSFLYAGGPSLILSLFFCFSPYFILPSLWEIPNDSAPIKLGLKSLSYRYSLVAGIAVSLPHVAELIATAIISTEQTNKRSVLTASLLFCLIIPDLVSLLYIAPSGDCKMHICIWTSKLMIFLFTAANFLCQLSQGFWNNKWFTLAASTVYFGSSIIIFTTYFQSDFRFLIQNLGVLIQGFGGTIFLRLSYQFLIKHSLDEKLDDGIKADDLFCRFANGCVLFVVFALFILYIGYGLPAWSECDGPYLTTYTLCLSVPNISMSVAFAMATRNEAFYIQKVKQMFVRYISHEMRTPLNTAVMGLQYLRVQMVKSRAQQDLLMIVDEVQGACEITVTILNEMLDYDKLQSGGMKLEKEELNVKDFLENTFSPFYLQAHQKDIELTYHFIHSELDTLIIDADKNKLAQVVRNLVSNALKFTPSGGTVQVKASILPNSDKDRGVYPILKLDVIDSGVGVTKDNQQLLFHQIVQFNPGKLQSGGGSGLGLYISKGIMDLHHGSLTIASEGIGHGCTFSITLVAKYDLHLIDDDDAASGNNECSRRTSVASRILGADHNKTYAKVTPSPTRPSHLQDVVGRGLGNRNLADYCKSYSDAEVVEPMLYKVLVVDDSTSNRKMLVRLLREKCSDIAEAVDGVDAVEKMTMAMQSQQSPLGGEMSVVSGNQYDVVLMDFIMPNMEGPAAAKCMRALGYTGIIVGITGNVLPSDREHFINSGADIVLTKPVHITDIEKALTMSQSKTK